jgi:hypothetical protein
LDFEYAGSTDDGTKDLRLLLDEKVFDNPKPVKLIRRLLSMGATETVSSWIFSQDLAQLARQ